MTTLRGVGSRWRFLRFLARITAIVFLGLLVVGMGTACFFPPGATFPPRSSDDWAVFNNAFIFASSMAIAGTIAVVVVFAIGGMRKWALEVASVVAILIAIFGAIVYTCLWLDLWLSRSRMGYSEFVHLRYTMLYLSEDIVGYNLPVGSLVGVLFGTIGGLLAVIARRRPRATIALVVGLLFAVAAAPVQRYAFDLVIVWGQIVRWFIDSPCLTDPFVPASGAISGAITGAIIAAGAVWKGRRQTPAPGGAPARA